MTVVTWLSRQNHANKEKADAMGKNRRRRLC